MMPSTNPQSPTRFVMNAFFAASPASFLSSVVTNQQIGAETHAFPADKHQQEIVRQHQRQHREHEQVQIRKEAIEAAVSVHVADGKDVNQEADEGDEERIGAAQPIHRQTEVSAETADLNPGPEVIEDGFGGTQRAVGLEGEIESDDGGDADRGTGNEADESSHFADAGRQTS